MPALETAFSLHTLHPGEWYFGNQHERLYTVLGSCVALTAWHPSLKVGGLCHYLLPESPGVAISDRRRVQIEDCRYADVALRTMKNAMQSFAPTHEFQIGLFGGGDMFSFGAAKTVGQENIRFAQDWLKRENIKLQQIEIGDTFSRSLFLSLRSGEITLKRYQMKAQ